MNKVILPTKKEFSSGGTVYKTEQNQFLWLVGEHSGYNKWVLPKGMIEEGETAIETAVREVEEEMGVKARVIGSEPIHTEQYWFVADYKKLHKTSQKPLRRVESYQENLGNKATPNRVKVFKTVTFYLMEYQSGNHTEHDWEMNAVEWLPIDQAIGKLAFDGERIALQKAHDTISQVQSTLSGGVA